MSWKGVFILVLISLLVVFTAQNHQAVDINFLVWSFTTSRAIVIFVSFSAGIVIGWVTAIMKRKKRGEVKEREQAK